MVTADIALSCGVSHSPCGPYFGWASQPSGMTPGATRWTFPRPVRAGPQIPRRCCEFGSRPCAHSTTDPRRTRAYTPSGAYPRRAGLSPDAGRDEPDAPSCEQTERIDVGTVEARTPVEMSPSGTHTTDRLAERDALADLDGRRDATVGRLQSIGVRHRDPQLTGHRTGEAYGTRHRGAHQLRPSRDQIGTAMPSTVGTVRLLEGPLHLARDRCHRDQWPYHSGGGTLGRGRHRRSRGAGCRCGRGGRRNGEGRG